MKNLKITNRYYLSETGLNTGILPLTIQINDRHQELSEFLKEMNVIISSDEIPEITLLNLKIYYESLNSVLNTYILEHP